ncbi:MAG: quinone oxidoreductase family protein, partial [Pelagibacteraceae bacterium]
MTKAIIIKKQGGPEVLELSDINLGKPGPDQIKVKNIAIGLNYIDTYHRSGLYPLSLPSGIGLEGAGKIIEIGSNVKDLSVGDNVSYAGGPPSSYAEERILPAQIAVKIPDGVSHKIAASIMTKGLTSFYLLYKTYKVTSKDVILFHAAAGGVGQIFSQWAKSLGCKLIGTVGSDEKIAIAKENGCDHVINYNKQDFVKEVKDITKGNGVSVVYDGVGKNTFHGSVECLKTRGMMVSFGNASGPLDPVNVPKDIQPKSLFLTRPSMNNYFTTRDEVLEGAAKLFEQ